jgi:maltose alpha-D-glucosyltransferase/alpha-amylase
MTPPSPVRASLKKVTLEDDPLWYKDAIIYEIHVKSFFDGNDDGIGDFPGLIRKLDYLQSLGVTCLWVLPFYPSPLKDDGYDIADYTNVHPSYGTMKDFRQFIRESHKRGMRVITELVVNHTSDQHPWFQAARKAPAGSPERDFYVWSDTDQRYAETRIIFTDTEKSNWTWDPVANAFYWHRFFHHQPDLNFDNPRVRRAVMKVMRFWLDAGVDGLRLDAVPYLVERDGTNCENLPETHKILKDMRREMDRHYKNRMFLAEANQWPTDVRAYMGDGDECHMAFHFPLMPRLFMALRQEDRHPVTEIMRQTPEIPPNCQWALFLRNHDELSLEMVTDEERDYMYFEYANDPQMRINIGIRRRLAPLMEYSRQRLELLTSLLFCFPGTPVLYYGDEIGMGDNVFLGDRNGVRTPMQWTGDRNAGFSRADPARLFTPPVMDPVCGYQAINVEAQERDPSSLLHWMRRLIALRNRFKVFSRGSMEFLYPQNRHVLAMIRRDENDTVLIVANLSRFLQPVELNLAAFKGLTPIEMTGRVEFPPIGDLPYFLTVAPHSFYWFQIQKPASPKTGWTEFKDLPEISPKAVTGTDLFEGRGKKLLEASLLPPFLARQRWFSGKARRPLTCRLLDWGELKKGPGSVFLVLVSVDTAGGGSDRYVVPLSVAQGAAADALFQNNPGAIVARFGPLDDHSILYDSARDEAAGVFLLDAMEAGTEMKTKYGLLKGFTTPLYKMVLRDTDKPFKVAMGSAEQSNTSLHYGERFILKIFRRMGFGVNPEMEMGLALSSPPVFNNIPKTVGGLDYLRKGEETSTLGIMHERMENQGSGWNHALAELGRFFERVVARGDEPPPADYLRRSVVALTEVEPPPIAAELLGGYLKAAATLGRRTAEMHLALASRMNAPDFTPEPLTSADLATYAQSMRDSAGKTLRTLESMLNRLPETARDQAHRILSERTRLLDRLKAPKTGELPSGKIRCHGDYHLGQVLWVENDFILLDFEGEPSRSLAERRMKQSPLKDVAGMLGSFDYAVLTALASHIADRPESATRLAPWGAFWRSAVASTFLKAYRDTVGDTGMIPTDSAVLESTLTLYQLDKTFYELHYEINNRPDWVFIPMEKILAVLDRK